MKKILIVLAFGVTAYLSAQEDIPEAVKGQEYGSGISQKSTYNVYTSDEIIDALNDKNQMKDIIIKAKVTGVCQKRGCWLTLDNEKKETVFVKMKDYGFFLPSSIMGKTVLLEGSAEKKITSIEELKHYAKDAKKSKEEIAKITTPKTEYRVLASGIKVID